MELVARAFLRFPVLGWLLRDAIHGRPDAKYYFFGNVFIGYAALIYVFGYPLLISTALVAAAAALTSLVILTATDLIALKH